MTHLTDDPEAAAALLRAGGLVAFPTETVYGLGASVFDADALARVFQAKGRPSDNPLIVHVASVAQIMEVAREVPEEAQKLIAAFFPGPLTLVLPRRASVPDVVTAGLPTVGVRMPRHPIALRFLSACGVPIAAPSANRSGRPSPTTWEAVLADLDGRIEAILRGPQSEAGLESTVVDVTGPVPVVLRPGAVSLEALRAVVPGTEASPVGPELLARSPGTRHRHYAPEARVLLWHETLPPPEEACAWIGLHEAPWPCDLCQVCESVARYAHELYRFFRNCDAAGVRTIVAELVPEEGIGVALNDRLRRAAAR